MLLGGYAAKLAPDVTVSTGPVRFALLVVLLAAVGFVASWLPARRAMAVDPVSALRAE